MWVRYLSRPRSPSPSAARRPYTVTVFVMMVMIVVNTVMMDVRRSHMTVSAEEGRWCCDRISGASPPTQRLNFVSHPMAVWIKLNVSHGLEEDVTRDILMFKTKPSITRSHVFELAPMQ